MLVDGQATCLNGKVQTLDLFLAQRGLSDDDGCLNDGRLNDLE